MPRKLTLLLALLIFTNLFAFGKSNITIYGKVIEKENGKPLPFATVSIHSLNNVVLGGTTSENDGSFKLNKAIDEECIIKISFIGFKDSTFKISPASDPDMNLGVIELKTDAVTLKSAIVTSRVPVIEQKLDKLVMNVSEAVATQGSSALEILKRAPGVSVDPSGNILLNGSQVQVWIDNRPSNLTGTDLEAILSSTDGSTIDKIEIISHPSSKYDAQGSGGIINIKSKKNFVKGLNGSIRGAYGAGLYNSLYNATDGTFNLNYRSEKNSISLSYNPRYNEGFFRFSTLTEMENGSITKSKTNFARLNKGHSLKLSEDFYANKRNIFGFVINIGSRELNDSSDATSGSEYFVNGIKTQNITTKIVNDMYAQNALFNLNYTRIFSGNQELTINGDYNYYYTGKNSYQNNHFFNTQNTEIRDPYVFKTDSDQYITIKSLKADYEHTFKNRLKIESGIKWSQSKTDNDLIWNDFINSDWVFNTTQQNEFIYTEDIGAAYFTAAREFNSKFNIKGGIRAEYTRSEGEWISSDTTTQKRKFDIFPTLFIGYNPTKNIRWGASYSLRIQRANFEQLNPQRFYIDASSCAVGNPELNPAYVHQITLSLGIAKNFNFGINTRITKNTIIQSPGFDALTGDKLLTWDNFGTQVMFGATATITEYPIYKWFIVNCNLLVSRVENRLVEYYNKRVFSKGNIMSSFVLPQNTKIEVYASFQSGITYGYFTLKPQSDLSVGIKKIVLNGKGNLTLMANDILGTSFTRVSLKDNLFKNYEFVQRSKSRRVTFTFSYSFGQSKATKQRKVGNVEESSRVNTGN